jgi:DNA-directed RNA polymerase specialized sigma subunit
MRNRAPQPGGQYVVRRERLQNVKSDAFLPLSARQRQAVRLFYGLDGEQPHKQREIAELFGVSVDMVSYFVRAGVKAVLHDQFT